MCNLMAIAIGATVAAGGASAYTQYQAGAAENKYYKQLAAQSDLEAGNALLEGQYALERGRQQSKVIQDVASQESKQLKGNQAAFNAATRAQLASQGISGVTAEDIAKTNLSKQQMDELALRYNADVKSYEAMTRAGYEDYQSRFKSYGLKTQAGQQRYAGKAAKYAGKVGAFNTLLGTAASVAAIGLLGGGAAPKTGMTSKQFGQNLIYGVK